MRGGRLLRGERSTTKNDRTAVWGTEHRKNLLHRWGRLRSAALYWLRRPQPQTRKLKLSYDRVRERWGQVRETCWNSSSPKSSEPCTNVQTGLFVRSSRLASRQEISSPVKRAMKNGQRNCVRDPN